MSSDIVVAIISGAVTIIVGVAGGWLGYRGSIKGAKEQIEHERNIMFDENKKQRAFAISVIRSFIVEEIRTNFSSLTGKTSDLTDRVKENDRPFDRYVNVNFKFEEFERGKYELIKYNDDIIQEVFDIYKIFKILDRIENLKDLSYSEYQEFQRIYKLGLHKYL